MNPFVEERGDRFSVQPFSMHAYPDHLHAEVEMLYVFEGEGSMTVDGAQYILQEGDLCLCCPGVVHGYMGSERVHALMMIFRPEQMPGFAALLAGGHPADPVIRKGRLAPDVGLCMEQLLQECKGGMDHGVLRGYMQVVLARTLPLLAMEHRAPESADVMYGILKYLSLHYREPVCLNDLAHALGVSKSYLSHSFSERLGVNFRTYLNTLRLNRACELLRLAELSVTDAAYESGFESYRTFNRAFAQKYSCTPSDYRRRHQAIEAKPSNEKPGPPA